MNDEFKLPIYFIENKEELSDNIKIDLELVKKNSSDEEAGLYNNLLETESEFGNKMIYMWSKYYTSDREFLIDSQKLYSSLSINTHDNKEEKNILEIVEKIKNKEKFEDTYLYLKDLYGYESINENYKFMLFYTIILILSPILSLLTPIIFLIIPYFLLRFKKINISLTTYFKTLKILLCKMPVCRMILTGDIKPSNILTIVFSGSMYIFQIYQNINQCIRLKEYVIESNNELYTVKKYMEKGKNNIENLLYITENMKSYEKFNNNILDFKNILEKYLSNLDSISEGNISVIKNIGVIRSEYYSLYMNEDISKILLYLCNFNGYLMNIRAINKNILENKITKAIYIEGNTKMKNMYYPEIREKIVKNNIILKNNKLITGVNASGKTTLIKTVLLNILLSQQIGYGYYDKGRVKLYDKLHSYLNIPDTSNRDSLFQAEARRCKLILDDIILNKNKEHFCIFDELYSGTNPIEASMAGYGYLKYLNNCDNVKFILTTHYLGMCNKLERICENGSIVNNNMKAYYKNKKLICTYKLKKGIAKVNGGVEVLKKLEYKKEIIDDAMNYN
jgi:hypothetical protein